MVIGANGSGKTTLLEAVYMMAYGRSFRQARDPNLVSHGKKSFHIHGVWQRYGPMLVQVKGKRGNTSIRLQGREIKRRKDVSESFPVLVESPQGRRLADGAPGERRRWLDALMITCFPGVGGHYQRYLRALMQRARLLRRRAGNEEIDVWEHQIVQHGLPVVAARIRLIEELNTQLEKETLLTEHPIRLDLTVGGEYTQDIWLERLKQKRLDDSRTGATRFGPHCDVLNIHFQDREIRSAGSRGQQKLAAIALKMAECGLWKRYRHLVPVLLLDDCLEALDSERQQHLLRRLVAFQGQVLMTSPTVARLPQDTEMQICELGTQAKAAQAAAIIMEEAA